MVSPHSGPYRLRYLEAHSPLGCGGVEFHNTQTYNDCGSLKSQPPTCDTTMATNSPIAVPERNLEAYTLLFQIENALRECIIAALNQAVGGLWHKERLPPDVLEKYRDGVAYERKCRWVHLAPHHPLYYVDFPDLRKVIESERNWREAFAPIFSRKDILAASLSEVEVVRNRVAHNRILMDDDVQIVRAAHQAIRQSMGNTRFDQLVLISAEVPAIRERLLCLRRAIQTACQSCSECAILNIREEMVRYSEQWWLTGDYLGEDVSEIHSLLTDLVDYTDLPRSRGVGYRIEAWVAARNIESRCATCIETIERVLLQERME